jgi:hypothetical protein
VTGWATLYGYPIGILANHRGVLFSEESQKATQFIELANQVRHATSVPAQHHRLHGRKAVRRRRDDQARLDDDQCGVELDRPAHLAADRRLLRRGSLRHVRTRLPIHVSSSPGRARSPRSWAAARGRVVDRQPCAAEARGQQVDEQADAAMRAAVEGQIEAESLPMVLSGMLYDDGIIDPTTPAPCWEWRAPS